MHRAILLVYVKFNDVSIERTAFERPCFFSATRIEFARETRRDINRRAEFIYEHKILDRSKQHTPSHSPRRVVGGRGWEGGKTVSDILRRSLRGASISNCIQFLWNSLLGRMLRRWSRVSRSLFSSRSPKFIIHRYSPHPSARIVPRAVARPKDLRVFPASTNVHFLSFYISIFNIFNN